MDIGFGADQRELRDNVREVLASACPADIARRSTTDPVAWAGLWKTVHDLGWTELAVFTEPDSDYSILDMVAVLEQCGAVAAPIPLLSSIGLAGGALRGAGTAGDPVLRTIADGVVATAGVQSQGSRLPGASFVVSTDGRVTGHAVSVPDASRSDLIVVLAREDGATDAVKVAVLETGACEIVEGQSIDPGRPLAEMTAHDVAPTLLVPVDEMSAIADQMTCAAAELVGVASAALNMSVSYANTRHQFGKPIGAFQSIKHALADNFVALERARSLTYSAVGVLADPDSSADARWTVAALAKAAANDAALGNTRTGIQVHGAIAQTWEHDMHLLLRRAWSGATLMGESTALYGAVGARFAATSDPRSSGATR